MIFFSKYPPMWVVLKKELYGKIKTWNIIPNYAISMQEKKITE